MRPRIDWTNVPVFVVGLVLFHAAWRKATFLFVPPGIYFAVAAVAMAYRKRWGHWMALAGLITIIAVSCIQLFQNFKVIPLLSVLGLSFITWEAFRQMRSDARDRNRPLTALVLLRRKPNNFLTATKLSEMVKQLWGNNVAPDKDGEKWFAAGQSPAFIVNAPDIMLLVNNFATPYWEEPNKVAEAVEELRLKKIIQEHTAWMSVDVLGLHDDSEARSAAYPTIGRLLAELVDDDCLALYCPEHDQIVACDDTIVEKLRRENPLEAFGELTFVPVMPVDGEDPRLKATVAEARERWPEFVAAFQAREGENHAVKAPITFEDNTEFIWIEVDEIKGDQVLGKLANDPVDLGDMKLGDPVSIAVSDVNDWNYLLDGEMKGGFSVKLITELQKGKPDK
jgi:uncharacterized protein YegJ (DUF2314 family)